jgi:hypothetical protein
MRRWLALLVVLLVLFGTFAPGSAWARGRGHGHHGCCVRWWPGAIVGGLVFGAVTAVTYPLWAAPPPTYVTPVYVPAPTYAAHPVYQHVPAPPVQREVVYAHGRHVLYGDGVTQAWQWVWIPAPPPPPPPAPSTQ